MAREDRNFIRPDSGLLPRAVLEVGLDPDASTAWCTYRGRGKPIVFIDTAVNDAQGRLARDLITEHDFVPLLAIEVARQLFDEHRRRTTLH